MSQEPEGEAFGPYRLVEMLGRGGMGEVWRAWDTRRRRMVALKRLTGGWADVAAFRTRFRREAEATAGLDSEHVIVIHDYGEIDGRLFIDMRLVAGGDLAGLLATNRQGLAPPRAVNLCAQIADGLDAAHRARLVHRDVKPSNVMLAPDAGGQRAYLVDFGIAKLADELTGAGITVSGTTLGTPAYMAPELFEQAGAAGPASDVYALGCVLFEMLTGRRVFMATTVPALMRQHLEDVPPAPSSVRPELAAYDPVVARALAKAPAERFRSAGALADAAVAVAVAAGRSGGTAPGAVPDERPGRAPDRPTRQLEHELDRSPTGWSRRRVLLTGLAGAAVVAVGGVGIAAATRSGHDPVAPPPVAPRPVLPGRAERVGPVLRSVNDVAFSPDGRRAYVIDGSSGEELTTLDTASGAVITRTPLEASVALSMALTPDGRRLYVTNTGTDQDPDHSVTVVDTAGGTTVAAVPVARGPWDIVASPDGRFVYVTNTGAGGQAPGRTVSVIDTSGDAVTATLPTGPGPGRLGIDGDGSRICVPNFFADPALGITVIDTSTGRTTTLPSGDAAPTAAVFSPDGRQIYVACHGRPGGAGTLQVVDVATRQVTPFVADSGDTSFAAPNHLTLSPDRRTLVVANTGADSGQNRDVSVIDILTTARHDVGIGGGAVATGVTPDGRAIWVAATSDDHGLTRIPLRPGP